MYDAIPFLGEQNERGRDREGGREGGEETTCHKPVHILTSLKFLHKVTASDYRRAREPLILLHFPS